MTAERRATAVEAAGTVHDMVVALEIVAGRRPGDGRTHEQVAAAALDGLAPRRSVPPAYEPSAWRRIAELEQWVAEVIREVSPEYLPRELDMQILERHPRR